MKFWIKTLLGRIGKFKQGEEKDIFIFSSRRSGSTLLMNMIYSQRGFNFVDQPLDIWRPNPYIDMLPCNELGKFIYLRTEEEKQKLYKYFDSILSRKIRVHSQWNIFSRNYNFIFDRFVIKILNAVPLIKWFEENFDIYILYLIRHPIPVALSIDKTKWACVAESFLRNDYFIENFITNKQESFSWNILKKDNMLEKYVLEWCLENLIPLKNIQPSWLTIFYEDLIINSEEKVELICSQLNLKNPKKMLTINKKPTRTATNESIKAMKNKNALSLIRKWKKIVNAEDEQRLMSILKAFDINIYQKGESMPKMKI